MADSSFNQTTTDQCGQVAADQDDATDQSSQVSPAEDDATTFIPITNSPGNNLQTGNNWSGAAEEEGERISEIRKTIKSHTIVAALIATVTFAAAFTVPGVSFRAGAGIGAWQSCRSHTTNATEGTDRDKAIMLRNRFTFLVAFPMESKRPLLAALFYGYLLTMFAITAMVMAFVMGLLPVLPGSSMPIFIMLPGFFLFFLNPTMFIMRVGIRST